MGLIIQFAIGWAVSHWVERPLPKLGVERAQNFQARAELELLKPSPNEPRVGQIGNQALPRA